MIWYAIFAILAAILGGSVVWMTTGFLRILTTLTFLTLLLLAPIVYFDTLSKPKDMNDEWLRGDDKVEIVGQVIRPGEGLYLLIQLPDIREPRYYSLPWNEKTKKLAQTLQDRSNKKMQSFMKYPWERSLEHERNIDVPPVEKEPPKQVEDLEYWQFGPPEEVLPIPSEPDRGV